MSHQLTGNAGLYHVAQELSRRGLRRKEAARYVGISTAKFDECVMDGRMPKPFRIDACVIWDLRRLNAAFDALSEVSELNTFADWS